MRYARVFFRPVIGARLLFGAALILSLVSTPHAQWSPKHWPSSHIATCLASNGSAVYAGIRATPGVLRSTDHGDTWVLLGGDDPRMLVSCITFLDSFVIVGTQGAGVFRSSDSGQTWVSGTIPANMQDIIAIVTHGRKLIASSDLYPFRSTDGGLTWEPANNGAPNSFSSYATLGSNIFAGCSVALYRTTNDGTMWYGVSPRPDSAIDLPQVAISGNTVIAAEYHAGYYRSTDLGFRWTAIDSFPHPGTVAAFTVSGKHVYAGRDGGTVVEYSPDAGIHWQPLTDGLGVTPAIFGMTNDGMYVYASSKDAIWRRSLADTTLAVAPETPMPEQLRVAVYPDPVLKTTNIKVVLARSSMVTIDVFNIAGRKLTTLYHGVLDAAEHTITWDASALPAGEYQIVAYCDGRASTSRVIHLTDK